MPDFKAQLLALRRSLMDAETTGAEASPTVTLCIGCARALE